MASIAHLLSSVYRAQHKETKQLVALKVFERTENGRHLANNERQFLAALTNEPGSRIPHFHGSSVIPDKELHYIAMEYFPFSSIASHLKQEGALRLEIAIEVLRQLVRLTAPPCFVAHSCTALWHGVSAAP